MSDTELFGRLRKDVREVCGGNWENYTISEEQKQEYLSILEAVNRSYPVFVAFFSDRVKITRADVILALNFIHAWKSEKLSFGTADFDVVADILNRARELAYHGDMISPEDLAYLRTTTGDMCVSVATKLLHLVAPRTYGILDRHVYSYLTGGDWEQALSYYGLVSCFDYWYILKSLIRDNDISDIHHQVNTWLGCEVSAIRAVELVMFVSGKMKSLAKEGDVLLELT